MDTVAQVILDSFHIDKEGFHHLTIPAGISDIEALKAMNQYFAQKNPAFMAQLKMNALYEENLPWLEQLGGAGSRDISQPRIVEIIPLVDGTVNSSCYEQIQLFEKLGLDFVPEIEQALVALAFACLGKSRIAAAPENPFPIIPDVFKDKFARGANMLAGMWDNPTCGISLVRVHDCAAPVYGAAGKKNKTSTTTT